MQRYTTDPCRMRGRGMVSGLGTRKFVKEKARLSSPPQAFDLATGSTSAENPISLEGIAPVSSRAYSLEGASPGLPPFPAFSGGRAAPSPAHALCSASPLPAPPCGCPSSLVQRGHAGPCPQPWVFPVFPLVWQRVGTAARPPPGHSLAGAGQFQF